MSGTVSIDADERGTTATVNFVLTDLVSTLLPLSQVVEFVPYSLGVGFRSNSPIVWCPELGCRLRLEWRRPRQALYVRHPGESLFSDPRGRRPPDGFVDLAQQLTLHCTDHSSLIWCRPRDPGGAGIEDAFADLVKVVTQREYTAPLHGAGE